MAPPLFLAEGGFSPPWIERHGLPAGSFWLLFKVCESDSHGKNNKVNWHHQDTEGHICNKVQNREPPKSVIWTVLSVWICQVCQVITKGFKHTTSSPEITKAAVIFQQQAKSPAFEPNRSWHKSVHQGPAEPGCLIVKAAEKTSLVWGEETQQHYSQLSPRQTPLGPALSVHLREMSVL